MEKSKPKRKHSEVRVVWWRFLRIWVVGPLVGWSVVYFLERPLSIFGDFDFISSLVIPSLSARFFQAICMHQAMNISRIRWFIATLAGPVLLTALYVFEITTETDSLLWDYIYTDAIAFILLWGIRPFIQWLFFLRNKLRFAWLWTITVPLLNGTLWNFYLIKPMHERNLITWTPLWGGTIPMVLSGLLMLWLLHNTQRTRLAVCPSSIPQP